MTKDIAINDVFHPLLNDKSKYLVLLGGAGSGKSVFAAQKCLYRAASSPGHRIIYIRKVAKTLRNSSFLLFKDIIKEWEIPCQIKETTMDIHFNGSEILSAGLDDVDKLKSIARPTSIWIEEATELKPSDLRQLIIRLRGVTNTYVQIILTFNPKSKKHWLYERFVTNPPAKMTMLKTTFLDNAFVDDEYGQMLMEFEGEDKNDFLVYALGEWGSKIKGLIYKYKLVDKMPECSEYTYGLDFGFNVATALIKIGIKEDDLFVEEMIYDKNLTNTALIALMLELDMVRTHNIYADAAEPMRIAEIYGKGFNIRSADKTVGKGIDTVKSMNIHIVKNSINIINEIDAYKWKEDKNELPLDEPFKRHDHAMDAMRYAVIAVRTTTKIGRGLVPKL